MTVSSARDEGIASPRPIRQGGHSIPNRLYVRADGLESEQCKHLAILAARLCRKISPKLSGRAASGIEPYWGKGWFGVKWDSPYLWHQEQGTKPHTMNNLAGKVIPMWIDDPTGKEARENPKAKTRMTANGRKQVLIFRKAAKKGERKKVAVRDSEGRLLRWRDVPKSFPGAPGRINSRNYTTGTISKLLVRPHQGVRWRHPGIVPREFMQHTLKAVAAEAGVPNLTVYAAYRRN